ncbi:MAG: hypothetical protein ACI9W2_004037 [Gammaproteobacteria bacterium]|jgi:hypothetical protein
MNITNTCYRRHRFPPEIIAHAVFVYHRFALRFGDVEDLLAERGVTASYETIRVWCAHFGGKFANRLQKRQPSGGRSLVFRRDAAPRSRRRLQAPRFFEIFCPCHPPGNWISIAFRSFGLRITVAQFGRLPEPITITITHWQWLSRIVSDALAVKLADVRGKVTLDDQPGQTFRV